MIFFLRDERWISVRYCSRPMWSLPNRSSWPSLSGWDTDCDQGPSSYSTPRRSTSLICITTAPLPTLSSGWAKDPSQMRPELECPTNSASESFSSFIDLCLWLQHSRWQHLTQFERAAGIPRWRHRDPASGQFDRPRHRLAVRLVHLVPWKLWTHHPPQRRCSGRSTCSRTE